MHHRGSFMLSYRYMAMRMKGVGTSTNSVGESEVLQDFMITPQEMSMGMHMLGVMYALSDGITLDGYGSIF